MRMHPYPSDVTDAQWDLIEPHLPPEPGGGRPRETSMRDVLDAISSILRTGCQGGYLPGDLPPKGTVWRYFDQGRPDGTLDTIHDLLRREVRTMEKPCNPGPPPASTASRSTRPPAASSGAATTTRTSTDGSATSSWTAWGCCWPCW
jgi:transposase